MTAEPVPEELPACSIEEVRDSWDQIVRPWSAFVRNADVHREQVHGPAFLTACGDVDGRRVLDVGCGEGWSSRELALRGARVTAIDISREMIEEADAHPLQPYQRIDYRVMDAVDVDRHFGLGSFDMVAACMSLHSMPNPAAALHAVRQVLKPDGQLIFSIPHPVTHMLGGRRKFRHLNDGLYVRAGDYFRSAPYRVRWNVGADDEWATIRWSRPHSEYVRMLRDAGFAIYDEIEPRAVAEHEERLRNAEELPYYLVLVAELARRPPPRD